MNEEQTLAIEELGKVETVKVYNQAYVDKQQKRIAELEAQIEKMKCCGNCDLNGSYAISCNQCENESNWVMADWEGIDRFYKEK